MVNITFIWCSRIYISWSVQYVEWLPLLVIVWKLYNVWLDTPSKRFVQYIGWCAEYLIWLKYTLNGDNGKKWRFILYHGEKVTVIGQFYLLLFHCKDFAIGINFISRSMYWIKLCSVGDSPVDKVKSKKKKKNPKYFVSDHLQTFLKLLSWNFNF